MNRRPLNSLPLSKAITDFINYKTAEGLSDRSVDSYRRILEHWAVFAGNRNIAQITDHDDLMVFVFAAGPFKVWRFARVRD